MPKTECYDLGFNWATSHPTPFTEVLAEESKRRKLSCLRVLNADAQRARQKVTDGRLRVSVFLNTQADGTSMGSRQMLLCRSLKAAGCLVVEDPDDAPIYANRALQLDYVERAGLPVPRRRVVDQ